MRKIRREVRRKVRMTLIEPRMPRMSRIGTTGKKTKETTSEAKQNDTNFTEFTPIDRSALFVTIRVIRVFTAAFPHRVFGKQDRRAKGPRMGRA